MCLVEVAPGPPKPQASCALPAAEGQTIKTDTPMVKKAREGVMEFLLINHPLDCPICDQGGECDLQDQAMAYGRGHSRFDENKRAVDDKYFGPIVKTSMTRCIQCTRCVRFAEEVAGTPTIGMLFRGEDEQITTYLEQAFHSELAGNLVDLCPVGALLSKPYSFEARPWELRKVPGIDVMDAVGTNIRMDVRQRQVMRILPRINDAVNEEWAHDKTRHHVDALVRGRLDRPWVREKGKLRKRAGPRRSTCSPSSSRRPAKKVAAIAGDLLDAETMYAAKALLAGAGSTLLEGRQTGLDYDVTSLARGAFNTPIAELENADVILLVGSNVRWEAPLVNTRLRKAVRRGAKVFAIGPEVDLTYKVEWLGDDLSLLGKLPKEAADAIKGAQAGDDRRPGCARRWGAGRGAGRLGPVHQGRLERLQRAAHRGGADGRACCSAMRRRAASPTSRRPSRSWSSCSAPTRSRRPISARRSRSMSATTATRARRRPTWCCRARPMPKSTAPTSTSRAGCRRSERAAFAPGDAREDWTIFRALSDLIGKPLPFDRFDQLPRGDDRRRARAGQEGIIDMPWSPPKLDAKASGPVSYPIKDFYLTNAICRASPTMRRCSEELVQGAEYLEAAE